MSLLQKRKKMFNWFAKKEPVKRKSLLEIGKEKHEETVRYNDERRQQRLAWCKKLLSELPQGLEVTLEEDMFKDPYVKIQFKTCFLKVFNSYYICKYYDHHDVGGSPYFLNRDSFAELIYSLMQEENESILP